MVDDAGNGWVAWSVVQRWADGAAAVPLTIAFVSLGAAVLMGRSLLDTVGRARTVSPLRERPRAKREDAGAP